MIEFQVINTGIEACDCKPSVFDASYRMKILLKTAGRSQTDSLSTNLLRINSAASISIELLEELLRLGCKNKEIFFSTRKTETDRTKDSC
jgi:hypothetical protein